jgi:glycosyltransferase involved in cell wall biosynthesis
LDKRVRYIFQNNRGLPAARNTGIKASSGEYVQFLDADDRIHNEKLEVQSQYFDHKKDVDVVFSDYALFRDEEPGTLIKPPPKKSRGDIKSDMLRGNFIVVNSPLSKRKAIDSVGGFDETLTSTEDWDLWLRMLLSGMVFRKLGERLAFVRIHPGRMTRNRLNMYSGRYQVIKKNLGDVPRGSIYWGSAKGCYVRSRLAVMRENLYRGKFSEVLRAILDKPYHISFRGIIDFVIETFVLLIKRTS